MPDFLDDETLRRIDQVVELAARDATDQQIAQQLGISTHTVATYWLRLRKKWGVNKRAALVARYFQDKLETQNQVLKQELARRLTAEEELSMAHVAIQAAYLSRGESMTEIVLDAQRRLRDAKRREETLGLYERASLCARSFAYEVEATDPFRCRFISPSCSLFGIDRLAILQDEISFWDCVHGPDTARLFELTRNSPFRPDVLYTHTYRLKTPQGPCWIIDTHRSLYQADGSLAGFAGVVMDIEPFVSAGLLRLEVTRLSQPAEVLPPYDLHPPVSHSVNPLP